MRYKGSDLLYIMGEKGSKRQTFSDEKLEIEREIFRLFDKATEEMSSSKLVTIILNELLVKRDHDFGSGEIYVLTSVLDSTGISEYKSPLFQGISDGMSLPLGAGMIIGLPKDPGLFADIHGVVMESDSDVRAVGEAIEKAKEDTNFNEIENIAKELTSFDPTKLTTIMNGVSIFLDVLVALLKNNRDDHVGTFHDFYLRQQGFGVGRHPQTGRHQYNDIEIAYTIEMIDA